MIYAKTLDNTYLTSNGDKSSLTVDNVSCKDGCGFHGVSQALIDKFYTLTTTLKKSHGISIYKHDNGSVCRCYNHNLAVGGAKDSGHLMGLAIDCTWVGELIHVKTIGEYASTLFNGVIYYADENFFHLDLKPRNAILTIRNQKTLKGLVL